MLKRIGAAGEDVVDLRGFWSRSQRSRLQAESRPMSLVFPRRGLRGPMDVMDLGEEDEGGGD